MIQARLIQHIGAAALLIAAGLSGGCATQGGGTAGSGAAGSAGSTADAPSDASITSAVRTALQQDDLLSSAAIDVASNQGEVTLTGRVPNERAFLRAISEARRVPGVKRVIAQLQY